METNLLSAHRSREPDKGRLPGLAASTRATPSQNIPSGRRQGPGQATALITSELAPAPKAHAWTFQIFPLLSLTFPYSLIPPATPQHTHFSYSLSPFISVQKQIIQAKCVSWLLEKVLCSMNCVVVTLRVVGGRGGDGKDYSPQS